jgi:hypothetical protein
MAHIKGPIQFNGRLGNIRSYWDSDTKQQTLSTIPEGGKKAFKNRKSAARVKELNREFAAVNIWTKLIREGNNDLSYLKKGRLNGKLVSIGKRIQLMNTVDNRGLRGVDSSKFNYPLVGFCMNNAHPFNDVCHVVPEITISDDHRAVTVKLTDFISFGKFKWSETLSYYRVFLNIFELPDVEWDTKRRAFVPVYEWSSLSNKTSVSEWIKIITDPIDIELSASFKENFIAKEKTTIVVTLGFEFASGMQYNTPYVVKDNGTCVIVGCF